MKQQVWRSASSQIFKELRRCRPDVRLSSNVLPGFSSQICEQIGSAHGMEVNCKNKVLKSNGMHWMLPFSVRTLASSSATESNHQTKQEKHDRDVAKKEDPFDPLTDQIPEQPVTFAEGASYSLVILAGLAVAAGAAYAVFKELIFEPKEYKIFGKALERVQNDSQVKVRIGSPITGYGQESRNRAARQRISNRKWTDEDGIERVEVNFYVRGPHGAGKVYSEMFKDKIDKNWKFTYLIVDVTSPTRTQLMLESYVPA
ncbi:hypothetical protein SUGI_0455340 [Cryptomeria japonica]|uniref:probable mitochondrial import inner membrane translocase subunit TIM21 isoform X2 n=1 Tax=Cryptomeria japonica TaxID=3369 RepID=UPI002408ABCA|nr:probable mitochondrial import inner membrane translocase subunit TIM21 isoform X2 [Cryptomeria japonica]XP_057847563.1 probable mitochondrial import inner membrane translocase subunit TIM21 isoform X2 [Cryptomeria japonica]GLJ23951.1 hypothetical protein SUGI_0455340 [Cryptomeria japonica]